MTTQERERLEGLVRDWRAGSAFIRSTDMAYGRAADDCADSLEEALTGMGDGWISVEERLPEDGEKVLALVEHIDDMRVVIGAYYRGSASFVLYQDEPSKLYGGWKVPFGYQITHWQPLPEGPKG